MRYLNAIAATGMLAVLTGCATASKVVVQDRLGPCHKMASQVHAPGTLQVYSARIAAGLDANAETFLWNDDYGKNEFVYGIGHTDYTIYQPDGAVFQRVRNGHGLNDDVPALISLPPGSYTVEAEAERYAGVNITVVIPVAIQPGQTTTVHLEPRWKPANEGMDPARLVRLADGRVLGCREQNLVSLNTP